MRHGADGNPTTAAEHLTAFIDQVNAWYSAGVLQIAGAQPLIDAAEALLQELNG